MSWVPGTTIVVDEVWNRKLWATRPVLVVEDRPDLLVVWCPKGTIRKVPTTPAGRPRASTRGERLATCLLEEAWDLVDHEWDVSTLMLMEPGALHATWVSFLENGDHWGWYVNLQRPFVRSDSAVTTMDLALDVLIAPDRSEWRWKDEDEFQLLVEAGLLGAEEAASVRAEALRVIDRAVACEPPFSDDWPRWTPDPAWETPTLPVGRESHGRTAPSSAR